jgi:uncharacterized protein (DUF58 family)
MVRTLESTPAGDWWIWLDLDQSTQAGEGENSTLEHSIILAASLAERGLSAGRSVGLIVNAQELVWLAPQSGEFQRLSILRALATVEPSPHSLAEQLESLSPAAERSASVIFITASVQVEWTTAMLSLRQQSTPPTVILLDPSSYGGAVDAKPLTDWLAQCGIAHFVVTRELMNQPEAQPGHRGQWEWRVGATGRAIARTQPSDQEWRVLA